MEKPKFLSQNLELSIDITDDEILKIKKVFLENILVEELLEKVNKKLRSSYLTRKENFKDNYQVDY